MLMWTNKGTFCSLPRISSSGLDINALGHLLYTLFLRFLRTVSVVKARCSSRPISSFYRLLGTLPWTLSRRTLQCPIPFQSHTRDKPIVVVLFMNVFRSFELSDEHVVHRVNFLQSKKAFDEGIARDIRTHL